MRFRRIGRVENAYEVTNKRNIQGVILTAAACYLRGHRWRRIRRTGTHALVCLRCTHLSTVEAQGRPDGGYPFTGELDNIEPPYPLSLSVAAAWKGACVT